MSVNVSIDLSGINRRFSTSHLNSVQYDLANQVMSDMDQFVPARRPFLANTAHITSGGHTIEYNTPYAKAQFYGVVGGKYPVRNYTTAIHPQATKRWDLKAKSLYGQQWADMVKTKL